MAGDQQQDGSLLSASELADMVFSIIESLTLNKEESVCEGLVFVIAEKITLFLNGETEALRPCRQWALVNSVVFELKKRSKPPGVLEKRVYKKILNQVMHLFDKRLASKCPGVTIPDNNGSATLDNNICDSNNNDGPSLSDGDDDGSRDSKNSGDEVVVRMLNDIKKDDKDKDDDESIDYEELLQKMQGIPKEQQQPKTTAQSLPNLQTNDSQQAPNTIEEQPQQQQQNNTEADIHAGLLALWQHNQFIKMACQYQCERIEHYLKQYKQYPPPPPVPRTSLAASVPDDMPPQSPPTPTLDHLFPKAPPPPNPSPPLDHLFPPPPPPPNPSPPLDHLFPPPPPNPFSNRQPKPQPNQFFQQPTPNRFFPQQQQQAMGYGWNPNPMMKPPFGPVPPPPPSVGPGMIPNNTFPTPMQQQPPLMPPQTTAVKKTLGRPYRGPQAYNNWHCFNNCFPITEEDLNNTRYIQDMIYQKLQTMEPKLNCPGWHLRHTKLKAKKIQTFFMYKKVLYDCTCNYIQNDKNIENCIFLLEVIFDRNTEESPAMLRWNGVGHSCSDKDEIFQFDPQQPHLKSKAKRDVERRFFNNRIDILYEENPDVGMLQIFEIFKKEHGFDSETKNNRKLAEHLTNHLKYLKFIDSTKEEEEEEEDV